MIKYFSEKYVSPSKIYIILADSYRRNIINIFIQPPNPSMSLTNMNTKPSSLAKVASINSPLKRISINPEKTSLQV